ncbi:MAG TPA: hypothetical protein VLK34_06400, partial [Nocardioidaceae bacterium]|nr:hypothetical protein [Nocardioidaceae bacterium]
ISYSHAADNELAPAVQRGLQALGRPWNRRRALEVFRDDTGLAVNPGLWSAIQAGLDASEHFVLLASPEAAESAWVNQEITHWADGHPVDRLLPVVTAGEWMWDSDAGDFDWAVCTAVPKALRGLFAEEPRHLDLRWARSQTDLDLRNSRFRDAIAQIAAPMHGMTPEDLERADVTHYRRLVRVRRAVAAALSVMLVIVAVAGVVAVRNGREAQRQKEIAQHNEQIAEQQAERAVALSLVAEAKVADPNAKELALLLRAEAAKLAPEDSWGSLVESVAAAPGLVATHDLPPDAQESDSLVTSPDAHQLAWVPAHDSIQVWDAQGGEAIGQPLECRVATCSPDDADAAVYQRPVASLAIGSDGTVAAEYTPAPGASGGLVLWDAGLRIGRLLGGSSGFGHPAFDPTAAHLAAVNADGKVRVWDTAATVVVPTFIADTYPPPTPLSPAALAFDPSGRVLAETSRDGDVVVWRMGHRDGWLGPDCSAEVSLASQGLLACIREGRVNVWDTERRVRIGVIAGAGQHVAHIALAPDGTLATSSADGVRLWDARGLAPTPGILPLRLAGPPPVLSFADGGRLLVTRSTDIREWALARWGVTGEAVERHPAAITAVAVSDDGLLASGDLDGHISVYSLADHAAAGTVPSVSNAVTALAYDSSGLLAAGDADGFVRLIDGSGTVVGRLDGKGDPVTSVAFAPDGRTIAVSYARPPGRQTWPRLPIRVWDTSTDEEVNKGVVAGSSYQVDAVAFSPDGALAASVGRSWAGLFDTQNWESDALFSQTDGDYAGLGFSPDGDTVAVSSRDPATGREQIVLSAVPDTDAPPEATLSVDGDLAVDALSFSPDGRLIASVGQTGAQLWDADTDLPIGLALGTSARALAFAPDSSVFAVGQDDGRVVVYPATVDGWEQAVCSMVGRNLSAAEWATFVRGALPYEQTCPQYPPAPGV